MTATTLENSTSTVPATPRVKRIFWDGRAFLKVKLKSLAAESRIIREMEKRPENCRSRHDLWAHRVYPVRAEARATLLAYGFIRGKDYRQIEADAKDHPDWKKVEMMVRKYGIIHYWENLTTAAREKINADTMVRFQEWKELALTPKKT